MWQSLRRRTWSWTPVPHIYIWFVAFTWAINSKCSSRMTSNSRVPSSLKSLRKKDAENKATCNKQVGLLEQGITKQKNTYRRLYSVTLLGWATEQTPPAPRIAPFLAAQATWEGAGRQVLPELLCWTHLLVTCELHAFDSRVAVCVCHIHFIRLSYSFYSHSPYQ